MQPHLRSLSTSLLAGAALAACAADSTGPGASGRQAMTISFAAPAASSASASRLDLAGSVLSTSAASGADVLVITKAEVVLARIELQKVGATCTSPADAGDDDRNDESNCAELELAPSVVDLPVNGTIATALNVTVPAGSYSALEAKISPVVSSSGGRDGAGSATFLTAHPELAGVSVRVQGTFNGKAFTYTGAPRAQFESQFVPPLTVSDKGANITVHVELANWFKSSSGALIDPATANAGGSNAKLVATNISQSFRAFRDDDHDDKDDHDEKGGGHS